MRKVLITLTVVWLSLLTLNAHAAIGSTGLVWEGVLQAIADSLSGPVVTSIAIVAAVSAGCTLMFNEANRGVRWAVGIVLGFAIATSIIGILGALGLTTALM